MPQLASFTINDGKATPVAHVFAPVKTDGSTAKWANRASATPQGYETLQIGVREPASANAAYTVSGTLTLPTTIVVNGVNQVDYSSKVDFTFRLAQKSTKVDRKDIALIVSNLFKDAQFVTMIENLEPAY